MKRGLLEILRCPKCEAPLSGSATQETHLEIREGTLRCTGPQRHEYRIAQGIIHFGVGLQHATVRKEVEYENSTYVGSEKLTDASVISRFPDALAEIWPHARHFGSDFRALIEDLPVTADSWTLDVGTASCWSSRLLAQKGGRVIAIDVNDSDYYGLRAAEIQFDAHGVFFERILQSMTCLPFQDAVFDHVTFNASFHHTPDLQATLRECHRVLNAGGVVAMVNEEFTSLRHVLFSSEKHSDGGSHHEISYRVMLREVRRLGFRPRLYLAEHVRSRLSQRLGPVLGAAVDRLLQAIPVMIRQLNSARLVLAKC